jgi:hypothetical protein
MQEYNIYKNGVVVEKSFAKVNIDHMKKRLRTLQGNTLHIINGDVIDVYRMINNRICFSHKFTK